MTRPTCWAVVVAAGRGARMGLATNKALLPIAGRSVLRRSLDALAASGCVDGIALVLAEADLASYDALVEREGACALVKCVVTGGETRQRSVYEGLKAVPVDIELIAIHDAARAMVPPGVVRATIESAQVFGSGVAATMLSDTVKRVDEAGLALETLPREQLRAVQTPQTFRGDLIRDAHERARLNGYEATDDAALVERYFGPVHLAVSLEGLRNRKLTTPEDLAMMTNMMAGDMRVGHGFDAHRLVEGRDLVLGGVTIAHETGLLGHSDADVAAHALMDALLGAAGLGDIGRHFPDNDAQYKGASSLALMRDVAAKLKGDGWRMVNCDVTIVAQRPKLAPHLDKMRANIAQALGISACAVNVKATTTERMGYEGREEGISASAVALIAGA